MLPESRRDKSIGFLTSASLKLEIGQLEEQIRRSGAVDQRIFLNTGGVDAFTTRVALRVRSRRLDSRAQAEAHVGSATDPREEPSELNEVIDRLREAHRTNGRGPFLLDAPLPPTVKCVDDDAAQISAALAATHRGPGRRRSSISVSRLSPNEGSRRASQTSPTAHFLRSVELHQTALNSLASDTQRKLGYLSLEDRALASRLKALVSQETRLAELGRSRTELSHLLSAYDKPDDELMKGPSLIDQLREAVAYHSLRREAEAQEIAENVARDAARERRHREAVDRAARSQQEETERLSREAEYAEGYERMRAELRAEVVHEVFGTGAVKPLPSTVIDNSPIILERYPCLGGPTVTLESILADPEGSQLFDELLRRERSLEARRREEEMLDAQFEAEIARQTQIVARLMAQREPERLRREEMKRLLETEQTSNIRARPVVARKLMDNPLFEGDDFDADSSWDMDTSGGSLPSLRSPRQGTVSQKSKKSNALRAAQRELNHLVELQLETEELQLRRGVHAQRLEARRIDSADQAHPSACYEVCDDEMMMQPQWRAPAIPTSISTAQAPPVTQSIAVEAAATAVSQPPVGPYPSASTPAPVAAMDSHLALLESQMATVERRDRVNRFRAVPAPD